MKEADFAAGKFAAGLVALDDYTVQINLVRPFPLMNRLTTVGGWIYPSGVVEACGKDFLATNPVGTGAYRLTAFVPDDRIDLVRFSSGWDKVSSGAPERVTIAVYSDALAAFEAFKTGKLDVVELDLGTMRQGKQYADKESHGLEFVTANYLDYLVLNMQQKPFDSIHVRRAINAAIDRKALAAVLSDTVTPAFGFIPPSSPVYRGKDDMEKSGFRFDPTLAKKHLQTYLDENGLDGLPLELTIDTGELPETVGQFVQASLVENLGIDVTLDKKTWPEVIQMAFGGKGLFHRFWWNIVTPGEDMYFLFYFPGQSPPNGLNVSYYDSQEFLAAYQDAFSCLDLAQRTPLVQAVEDRMIEDAVAVPLFHKNFCYLVRKGIELPVNGFLRKAYGDAVRSAG